MTDALAAQKSGHRPIERRPVIVAILFFLGLLIFEQIFLSSIGGGTISRHFAEGTYGRMLVVIGLSAASLIFSGLFIALSFVSSKWLRLVYFVIFSFVTFVEYSHYKAFGGFSRFQMAEVAFFSADWRFLLNSAFIYFNPLFIVPVVVFGLLLFWITSQKTLGIKAFFSILFVVCAFFGATAYFTKNTFYVNSLASGFRTALSFPVIWYVGTNDADSKAIHYRAARDKIDFKSSDTPKRNIIFIVDESVRGDYLSINGYGKSTTAFLDGLNRQGFVVNWGIAASGATCSTDSNNILFTGISQLPDLKYDVYHWPTILQYAKAMNYRTYFIDSQVTGRWFGKPADLAFADVWIREHDFNESGDDRFDNDAKAARKIREIIQGSTGNFIWVNKFGVHKPYTDSYPQTGKDTVSDKFYVDYDERFDRETLIRNYEAGVSYNSDSFFSNLFANGEPANSDFYVYTSDHGQTLREEGATVSHCSEQRTAAVVPLLMITGLTSKPKVESSFEASHFNIFATMLDLIEFPEDERKYSYPISLLKAGNADSVPRFYYSGEINRKDGGSTHRFD